MNQYVRLRSAFLISGIIAVSQFHGAVLASEHPKFTPVDPEVIQNIAYKQTQSGMLLLDLYPTAPSDRPAPVILFIHGGGWKNGSKQAARNNAVWIRQHGFAVVSINYRLTDQAQWPAQIEDCYDAVRWIRINAKHYGFDPDQIGVWGMSAGGHLASLLGTRTSHQQNEISSKVQAVCDFFGPADLLTMPANVITQTRTYAQVAQSNGAKLLGAAIPDCLEKAKDASPLYHVSDDDPPFLIMHGNADPGVPVEQSQRFAQALQTHAVPTTLVILDGAAHGGKEFQSPSAQAQILKFFQQTLMHAR